MRYPVVLTRDTNDTFMVTFPDVPEAVTFGGTVEDALAHGVDALATIIEAFMKDRRDVPVPSARGRRFVDVPVVMAVKVRLYQTMRAQKVGKSELGRRLQMHPPQVDRLLTMRHASRFDQLEDAFSALGKRIVMEVEDAPVPKSAKTAVTARSVARGARRVTRSVAGRALAKAASRRA